MHKLILVGVTAGIAASIPMLYQSNPETFHKLVRSVAGHNEAAAVRPPAMGEAPRLAAAVIGRQARIESDERGHFSGTFLLNGRRIEALVDTGATALAINVSTARRIGIHLAPSDFIYSVTTANGKTKAAGATIREVEIGRIRQTDVEAIVLDDTALSGTLVGMSFLKRLSKVEVVDGALLLRQ